MSREKTRPWRSLEQRPEAYSSFCPRGSDISQERQPKVSKKSWYFIKAELMQEIKENLNKYEGNETETDANRTDT